MHDRIIDNVGQYKAEDLEKYIRNGVVTLEELRQQGLNVTTRHQIEKLLQNDPEEDDWQHVCSVNTEAAYNDFLNKYPEGNHRSEAKRQRDLLHIDIIAARQDDEDKQVWEQVDKSSIQALQDFIDNNPKNIFKSDALRCKNKLVGKSRLSGKERVIGVISSQADDIPEKIRELIDNNEATENDVIEIFREDHNVLPVKIVEKLDGVIDFSRLKDSGIDDDFIKHLYDTSSLSESNLDTNVSPLTVIPDGFTEIYFWGVPSSGKTCAVGSIMSAMTQGQGVDFAMPYEDSQGKDYMQPLAALFRKDSVFILPPRTKVEETFEMRYLITDDKGVEHKIAFIDLSGELFECMSKSNSRHKLTQKQQSALEVLENILVNNRSQNPKIHFFVIEYGGEKEKYKGVTQNELLLSCLSYLDSKSILKDNTIGAYLIITKSDLAAYRKGLSDSEIGEYIGEYIDEHYSGFYNGLIDRMNKWGICTRKGKPVVKRFPFSIGEVCFQNWCIYDPEWTQYIIEEIKNRSYGEETGKIGKLKKRMRK